MATLETVLNLHGKGSSNWTKLFLAMACQRQMQPERARTLLEQTRLDDNADWEQALIHRRLREEATQLLQEGPQPQR